MSSFDAIEKANFPAESLKLIRCGSSFTWFCCRVMGDLEAVICFCNSVNAVFFSFIMNSSENRDVGIISIPTISISILKNIEGISIAVLSLSIKANPVSRIPNTITSINIHNPQNTIPRSFRLNAWYSKMRLKDSTMKPNPTTVAVYNIKELIPIIFIIDTVPRGLYMMINNAAKDATSSKK